MALLLCIEAGTDIGSIALAKNDRLLSLRESCESRQHAQNLAVYVEEILRENDLDAKDLDAVAVGMGPGSYTGLRICVSLAKGICYGAGIPLIAVGSLEALTRVALEDYEAGILNVDDISDAILLPMIDARRMEVYCQQFDAQAHPLSGVEAKVVTAESFLDERRSGRTMVLFGSGAAKCKELFPEDNVRLVEVTPSARGLVKKPAYEAFRHKNFEDIAYLSLFISKDFCRSPSSKKNFDYICTHKPKGWTLTYGVMATLQILDLSFLVRIRYQSTKPALQDAGFLCIEAFYVLEIEVDALRILIGLPTIIGL